VSDSERFELCIRVGGVVVFPSDTVYGLACDVENRVAVERLYLLKRRRPDKPAAVMFFDLDEALAALPELRPRTRAALERVLPGPVTVVVPNPAGRFPLAGPGESETLGVRVPLVPALEGVRVAVLQSSANFAGEADAPRLGDVPESIRAAADLLIDGGELPGTPSTVLDLRAYEDSGGWSVLRAGAVSGEQLNVALRGH
jgi:L-threonylcarbamoyladenylate synthase